ncbi:MAG: hypothetical protein HC889_14730 [Synechococcaceae cyanobacterium SM1_2_3]|nr:hypothetical protein [Synechococcaceae cyanobacterium SM1_2_3]
MFGIEPGACGLRLPLAIQTSLARNPAWFIPDTAFNGCMAAEKARQPRKY